MKILHLMPYSPFPMTFGGALREYYIMKNLAEEHELTVVTYGTSEEKFEMKQRLDDKINEIHTISDPMARSYRRMSQLFALCTNKSYAYWHSYKKEMQLLLDDLLAKNDFDLIQTEFSMMGNMDLKSDALKVLDAHNVEYDNFRRMYEKSDSLLRSRFYHREYQKMYQEEIASFKQQDMLFTTSERDKEIIDQDVPEVPKRVIPNGVDTSYFSSSDDASEPYSLVFTGMMAYVPNDDGMLYFIDEILPLIREQIPQTKLYVVGKRPTKALKSRAGDHIQITGFVDDVRPYIDKASVYVVPLRMGGGTRLKVLEALSMKKAVVSTSIGCEGIDVEDGESIFVQDDPAAFADRVVELLKSKEKRKRISENGYQVVKEKYEWNVVGKKMLEIYDSLFQEVDKAPAM